MLLLLFNPVESGFNHVSNLLSKACNKLNIVQQGDPIIILIWSGSAC